MPAAQNSSVLEKPGTTIPGLLAFAGLVLLLILSLAAFITAENEAGNVAGGNIISGILLLTLAGIAMPGFFLVQPNQTKVLILFGKYVGTVKEPGWHWANPFTSTERQKVSLRIQNFTTEISKVNDADGNPIEIAAVIVWHVEDTARAVFEVEDYHDFVRIQSETAIRHLGTQYPYEDHTGTAVSLRANPDEIATSLHTELQNRLTEAGVKVVETRLTHLAYATEIAEAMLRRQQASAIIAARRAIVEGAVGMVEEALTMLNTRNVVNLNEEQKAALVANLLVVLTSEQQTQPVLNTSA